MALLEDGPDIDHGVDIRARGVYLRTGDSGDSARNSHSARMPRGRRGGILRAGKGEEAPAAVGLDRVAEMHRLGVGQADDRRRMEAHADRQALGQMLVRRLAGRWSTAGILVAVPAVIAPVLDEIVLELRRIDAFAVGIGAPFGGALSMLGPLAIEVDQLLGDGLALRRVGMQEVAARTAPAGPTPASSPD